MLVVSSVSSNSFANEVSTTNARSTSYTSSMSLSGNSTLTGTGRSYDAGSHSISMKITWKANSDYNRCKVTLQKSSLGGYEYKNSTLMYLTNVGQTYSASMGTQTKGTYRYFFDNRASTLGGSYYDSFTANPVIMKSV